ncbi:MAG: YecA family protein [bacterium]
MRDSEINRNDPCPCGSGKKYKKCCMKESEKVSMREVFDDYMEWNKEFEKELKERTETEIAYDNVILEELRKGKSIKRALEVAAIKFPDEALQYDSNNINDIRDHYEYLLTHEEIKNRMQQMSN